MMAVQTQGNRETEEILSGQKVHTSIYKTTKYSMVTTINNTGVKSVAYLKDARRDLRSSYHAHKFVIT